MSWGDDDDWEWCRRCAAAYSESESGETDCSFHPGRRIDSVWECCHTRNDMGCATGSHIRATEAEARAIRAVTRERRDRAAGYLPDERRCERCWSRYRRSENRLDACRYHPGTLKDYDRHDAPGDGYAGDFWDCCTYVLAADGDRSHGCTTGWHVESAASDLGPLGNKYEAQRANEAALVAAYVAKAGAGAQERVSRTRGRVEEFLAGQRPTGLHELDWEDVAVLEGPILGWLIARLRDPRYPTERRLDVARLVRDVETRVDLVRLVG